MSDKHLAQQSRVADANVFEDEQQGFHQGLGSRQLQMIAIGGAIGTGLFLGAGGRLAKAGPALAIDYLLCGLIAYLILRALGELVVHRPSSGSFVSYAREFYGEKFAFATGWFYWIHWCMTSIVDSTAIAIYVKWFGQYSNFIAHAPQWGMAFLVVVVVVTMNLISVKVFGELEFWFALIKVVALCIFLVLGICFVIFGTPTGAETGVRLITENGGLFPHGILPAFVVMQGVVFAYASIELVGTTSGETRDARKVIPKAINTVIWRVAIFYVGSVVLLVLLLPYTAYSADESPFVTFFKSIGVDVAAPIMELVVITAALSSLNAGMYSTGRIMHSMSIAGSGPKFAGKLTKNGVPFGGILMTATITLCGVVLNMIVPKQAFEIVLNAASIGIITGWGTIALCHMKFVSLVKKGVYKRPEYRMPGAPFSDWIILAFLVLVVVLIACDFPVGTYALSILLVIIPGLIIGWYACRDRIMAMAAVRDGYTGISPVVADRTPNNWIKERDTARKVEEANASAQKSSNYYEAKEAINRSKHHRGRKK